MTGYRQKLGISGETAASEYLEQKGYTIIERNWRCKRGEIDIIARKDKYYIFIEVKTAGTKSGLDPRTYLSGAKLKRFEAAAICYLQDIAKELDPYYRFDFIAVKKSRDEFEIDHFKGVTADQYL